MPGPPSEDARGRDEPPTGGEPVRRAAQYRVDRLRAQERVEEGPGSAVAGAADTVGSDPEGDGVAGPGSGGGLSEEEAARRRMADRGAWADELVRQAMARGEFDDLAYAGKPIPGLAGPHDPDWWVKGLVEREQITGVLPEALQLRKDDAALDDRLDRVHDEDSARALVEEFNARVLAARRQLLGGPPVVTPTRDVEEEVTRWADRRRQRVDETERRRAQDHTGNVDPPRRRWWPRRR